jgi:hypothetical protein
MTGDYKDSDEVRNISALFIRSRNEGVAERLAISTWSNKLLDAKATSTGQCAFPHVAFSRPERY